MFHVPIFSHSQALPAFQYNIERSRPGSGNSYMSGGVVANPSSGGCGLTE